MGKSGKTVLAALVAAAVGAAVWAAIAYLANIEIGWIAWGVGALVGFAVAAVSGERSMHFGLIAVVFTILSICGGKYAAVQLEIHKAIGDSNWEQQYDSPEFMVSLLADDLIVARMVADQPVNWPGGAVPDHMPEKQADYPPDIWRQAQSQWDAMPSDEQTQMRTQRREDHRGALDDLRSALAMEGFKDAFGLLDIVFFGLAIVTAYQIAARNADA